LDADGRLFAGPKDELSSYAYYGADVSAAADGVVVEVLDAVPDAVPGGFEQNPNPTPQNLLGNHVVIDISGGRFIMYAHMQPGSIRVRVGERVAQGQVIGVLGNSGNSDAPHLHLHVMDGPSPLASEGLPFRFRSFDSEGTVTNDLETSIQEGEPAVIVPALAGEHRDEMPLQNQLIRFP
jgi:murein DD-endopeptidase MepM/ murein hydrolase activator NlpD